jgi:superfamily II DNA or RNA helicase
MNDKKNNINNKNEDKMDDKIKSNLLSYQIQHTQNIVRIITDNLACLDASDTGTGKTYCAIASCKILKLQPIIICPKSVIATWRNVCKLFDIVPYIIINYESLRTGNNFDKLKKTIVNKKPYFEFENISNIIYIFDEVHRCANLDTENSALLFAAKKSKSPILILSATIADFPEKFKPFFYILNFIDPEQVKESKIDDIKYMRIIDEWIYRDKKPMVRIHTMLYPKRASRMRIDVIGDLFPQTQITATPYTLDKKRALEIEVEYSKLHLELEEIKNKKSKDKINPLTIILRAHQRIEILKIPTFIELCNDFRQNNYSVVIFVNFTKTLEALCDMLHTTSKIYGQQTQEERDKIIIDFQENKTNIIVCNIKAGGIGISLHDIYGNHPRVSLISPTWSSIDLVQALGRIHRAGGKSKSLQRIIYTADTVEENIADKLKNKLFNINSINNGDLDLTNIDFENIRKKI